MASKVTAEALQDYRNKVPLKTILERYNISKTQFYRRLKQLDEETRGWRGFSDDKWPEIIQKYESGVTLADLIIQYDTCQETLSKGLKDRGVRIRIPSEYTQKFTEEQKQQAVLNYQNGMTVEEAGKFCEASYTTVYFWLKEANCQIRSQIVYGGDRDFFKNIDNEKAAYWFGFLAADGHISRNQYLRVLLSAKDKAHLELFQKHLRHTGTIKEYTKVREWPDRQPREYSFAKLSLCMSANCSYLINHGLLKIKDGDYSTLNRLPQKVFRHFLRGYFDGDGSICFTKTVWSWYICGQHKDILEYFAARMPCVTRTNPHRSSAHDWIYRIKFMGNQMVPRICRWLYKDATVYLDRKHTLALEAMS